MTKVNCLTCGNPTPTGAKCPGCATINHLSGTKVVYAGGINRATAMANPEYAMPTDGTALYTRWQVDAMLRAALVDRRDEWIVKSIDERVEALMAMFTTEKPQYDEHGVPICDLPFVTGMTVLDEGGSVVLDAGPGTVHPTTGITREKP